ncbi:hypothetical protein Htur_5009 (plasmid) [Haloterrigena turkmenica DSM 5511]|uniref:DUF5658 domain-containing protein n=1 Tax=Haloterrigena turkmenica (strain ATCC 51198 / DSM 5511 / JCM 9101 / NCIMB 13204 / VKM B-1734 / 4k) TaxID=543526 RepID=D2S3F0_HALTV|nr:hypothetical protein [Haloterrigena turkmenica]ADB63897.1 hypothetical protein Htur_5009 [Haloterrigena turkmenica DSM 5511]
MSYADSRQSLETPSLKPTLWILALVLFGVGDLVTTIYFIAEFGAVETHPIGGPAIDALGFWALVPLKALAVGVCYGLYRLAPREYAIGVPIELILLGGYLSVWNTVVSLTGSTPF